MRAIPFAVLMKAYPRKRDIDHDALFRLLGWDDLIKMGIPAQRDRSFRPNVTGHSGPS